jgi:hypothetical protein
LRDCIYVSVHSIHAYLAGQMKGSRATEGHIPVHHSRRAEAKERKPVGQTAVVIAWNR